MKLNTVDTRTFSPKREKPSKACISVFFLTFKN